MRIDHLAFRVASRHHTANFFKKALGYRQCIRVPRGFKVNFDDGTFAKCSVLIPPERKINGMSWNMLMPVPNFPEKLQEYHQPPEIFISEGSPNSIVDKWVKRNGNRLHHVALQVDDIDATKSEWIKNGFATFATEESLECPGLKQIFTDPSELTGCVWELIERGPNDNGFCIDTYFGSGFCS